MSHGPASLLTVWTTVSHPVSELSHQLPVLTCQRRAAPSGRVELGGSHPHPEIPVSHSGYVIPHWLPTCWQLGWFQKQIVSPLWLQWLDFLCLLLCFRCTLARVAVVLNHCAEAWLGHVWSSIEWFESQQVSIYLFWNEITFALHVYTMKYC